MRSTQRRFLQEIPTYGLPLENVFPSSCVSGWYLGILILTMAFAAVDSKSAKDDGEIEREGEREKKIESAG